MKKHFLCLLVFAMVLTLLAGCGAKTTPATDEKLAATTAAPAEETAAESTPEVTENFSGTLEYWSSWNENEGQAQVLKAAAEDFMALYPDVKINFTWSGRDNRNLALAALEAGTQIDAFDANVDQIQMLWSDHIVDLSEYFDKVYSFTNGKTYRECVLPSMTALVESLWDGAPKSIPYNPQAYMIFCNKNIFDEVGITEYPTTWDGFVDVCVKIKEAGYTPITSDTYYAPSWFGYYVSRLLGNDAVTELAFDSSKWDDPAVLEAAKAIEELAKLGVFDSNMSANVYPAAQQDMVISEDVAMYINGTWLPSEVLDATGDDYVWGTFAFPEVPNEIAGQEAGCYGSWGISVTDKASDASKEIAAAFAAFVTTGKYDQMMSDDANVVPIGVDSTWPEPLTEAKDIIANFTIRYSSQTGIVTNSDSKQIIVDACCKLYTGQITTEEFIAEARNF